MHTACMLVVPLVLGTPPGLSSKVPVTSFVEQPNLQPAARLDIEPAPSRWRRPVTRGVQRFRLTASDSETRDRPAVTESTHDHTAGQPQEGAQQQAALPLLVDGAQHPELISDEVAYRHFLSVTAVTAAASAKEMSRRDVFLGQVGLSPADHEAYVIALSGVREELTSLDQQMLLAHGDASVLPQLRLRRGQVLDDATARILAALSPDGQARLKQHINRHVKQHIRIYGNAQ